MKNDSGLFEVGCGVIIFIAVIVGFLKIIFDGIVMGLGVIIGFIISTISTIKYLVISNMILIVFLIIVVIIACIVVPIILNRKYIFLYKNILVNYRNDAKIYQFFNTYDRDYNENNDNILVLSNEIENKYLIHKVLNTVLCL